MYEHCSLHFTSPSSPFNFSHAPLIKFIAPYSLVSILHTYVCTHTHTHVFRAEHLGLGDLWGFISGADGFSQDQQVLTASISLSRVGSLWDFSQKSDYSPLQAVGKFLARYSNRLLAKQFFPFLWPLNFPCTSIRPKSELCFPHGLLGAKRQSCSTKD